MLARTISPNVRLVRSSAVVRRPARRGRRPRPRSGPRRAFPVVPPARAAVGRGRGRDGHGVTLPSAAVDEHYPAEWESDVVLTDGGTVRVRPIRGDDDAALLGLYDRLSTSRSTCVSSRRCRARPPQLERLTQRRLRQPHGARRAARRRDRRGRALRPTAAPTRPRSHSPCRTTNRVAASARCCSSTSPWSRARTASRRSSPTRCPTTAACSTCSATRAAGRREFADGAVRVTFPIEPTEASRRSRRAEQIAEAASIRRLLAPRSIAVIGASRRPGTIGHELFRNLLADDFPGRCIP